MYCIYCIKNEEKIVYVGMTKNFQRRVWEHRYRKGLSKTYTFDILFEKLPFDEAKQKEKEMIKKYNTIKNGMNIVFGTGGVPTNKGTFKNGNIEWKKRLIKKVLCVENGTIYNSVQECAKDMNLNESSIYHVCNGQTKTYKKLHFIYK